jgi:putative transposase
LVYRTEGDREVFLARAYAQDLETEQLSIDEAKASSRKVREAGKAVSNRSILVQVRDRETFLTQKKTKKERQKAQQGGIRKAKQPVSMEPEPEEVVSNNSEAKPEMPSVFDYEQMREDYRW